MHVHLISPCFPRDVKLDGLKGLFLCTIKLGEFILKRRVKINATDISSVLVLSMSQGVKGSRSYL